MNTSKIAEYLLEIKAVRLSTSQPFTWSSGWKSPIYCDNRLILSFPDIRDRIKDAFVEVIQEKYPQAEGIAGVATGGIAMGALVADALRLPFIYVRPTPKSHGLQNQIEGKLESQRAFVVIEDLVSTGSSSAAAVQAIQDSGATVLGTVAIFGYGFEEAEKTFAATQTPFTTLSNLPALLEQAQRMQYIQPAEMESILDWRQQPETWKG
jgi:orotate phosphoribosyltransferase